METVHGYDPLRKSNCEGEERVKSQLKGEVGWRQKLLIFYLFQRHAVSDPREKKRFRT